MMAARATPQPWATYTQPLRLENMDAEDAAPYRRVVIACDDIRGMVAAGVPRITALTVPPWHYLELETGHWPMFSAPEELAERLSGLASGGADD